MEVSIVFNIIKKLVFFFFQQLLSFFFLIGKLDMQCIFIAKKEQT
jgi:hypothetical protein